MFGSQVIETAIGLAVMFFVIAAASSAFVEVVARWTSKRAKHLEDAIGAMLVGDANAADADVKNAFDAVKGTSTYQAALRAAGQQGLWRWKRKARPSYLSAKGFADALTELMTDPAKQWAFQDLPLGLQSRLRPILLSSQGDAVRARASLEQWFDETMGRVEGAYKRWATAILFCVGLAIAILANASTIDVANRLYHDPATRQAVVEATTTFAKEQQADGDKSKLESFADANDELTALKLPVGWGGGFHFSLIPGWLITALLVMLGAPFWFDALTKLVSLRSSGTKPPDAKDDATSSTTVAARQLERVAPELGVADARLMRAAISGVSRTTEPTPIQQLLDVYLRRMLLGDPELTLVDPTPQ